jgi:hypothetical protein
MIRSMKKKLNMSTTEHPKTIDLVALEQEKEVFQHEALNYNTKVLQLENEKVNWSQGHVEISNMVVVVPCTTEERNMSGHIISKEGMKVDPNRVEGILKIGVPKSKKEVQSFLVKVNFLRRFIPNLAEIIKYITNMVKKGNEIKWAPEARKYFEDIKVALTKAPVLASPNFEKDFILFSFSSDHTIVGVLIQKDDKIFENPIAYYNKRLRDDPLNYDIMEKQAYALVKALKESRVYILHSHTTTCVPSSYVKDILTQPDP